MDTKQKTDDAEVKFSSVKQHISEINPNKLRSSISAYDKDFIGFNKLGLTDIRRDLSSLSQRRMIDICFWLWENYPLSKWIIEIIVSFVLAEGMPWKAKDPLVNEILSDFWYDSVNRMDLYIDKYVRELYIYGELCFPVKVSPANGRVRLGYIDPKQIENVHIDLENVKIVIGVETVGKPGEKGRAYKTILGKDVENFLSADALKARKTYKDGECFFFAINNVTNSPRGRSELLPIADWIDVYENFLYDYAEKWAQQNTFVWDLLVKNASDEGKINKHVADLNRTAGIPGSTYGHNEGIELKPLSPDLKSLEVNIGARIIRNHILGGVGFPSHWYGGGEDVNKASSTQMAVPTMKILSARQKYFRHIIESLFDYQIENAIKYNKVSYGKLKSKDNAYEVITPEMATADLSRFGAVIKNVADGLSVAEDRKWLDKTTAMEAMLVCLGFLGKEVDFLEVQDRLKESKNA